MVFKRGKDFFAGLLLTGFTVFIWGITFISTKFLVNDFSALEILCVRFLLAYITLWILHPKAVRLPSKKSEILFCVAGLSGITVYQFLENAALTFSAASNVSVIVSLAPIFSAITAQIFLKEKHITFFFLAGFAVAILGVVFVSFNGAKTFHVNPKGDALAMGSALSWSFYTVAVSEINRLPIHKLAAVRRIFFYALLWMLPLVFLGAFTKAGTGSGIARVVFAADVNRMRFSKPLNWVNFLFLGVIASALCFAAWNTACEKLGTMRATLGIYLIPVVTIVFAFIFLGEKITLLGMLGAVLAIAGLAISGIKIKKIKNR